MNARRFIIAISMLSFSLNALADDLTACKFTYRKFETVLNAKVFAQNSTSALDEAARYRTMDIKQDWLNKKVEWFNEIIAQNPATDAGDLKRLLSDSSNYGVDAVTNPKPRDAFYDAVQLAKVDPKAVRQFLEHDVDSEFTFYKNTFVNNGYGNLMALWLYVAQDASLDEQLDFVLKFKTLFTSAGALTSIVNRNLENPENLRKIFIRTAGVMDPVMSQSSLWIAAAMALPPECMN